MLSYSTGAGNRCLEQNDTSSHNLARIFATVPKAQHHPSHTAPTPTKGLLGRLELIWALLWVGAMAGGTMKGLPKGAWAPQYSLIGTNSS